MLACVREGWAVSFTPKPNTWGATTEGVLTFSHTRAAPRTLAGELDALKLFATSHVPIHYTVDLTFPDALLKAVTKHYTRFVQAPRAP